MARNAILALVEGLKVSDVRPFVESLRSSTFDGELVFFTRNSSTELISYFASLSIATSTYRRARLSFLSIPLLAALNMVFADKLLGKFSQLKSVRQALAKLFWNIQASRYFFYRDFLKNNQRKYDYVMVADVRDVIFQADPFVFDYGDMLHIFEEYPAVPIGRQEANRNWIEEVFGEAVLEKLKALPIICSGVVVGSSSSMLGYLEQMCEQLSKKSASCGFDQGVHNYLIREGRIMNVKIHPFNTAPVVHLGIAPVAEIRIENGKVVDRNGSICAVVHQYDRHQVLRELFIKHGTQG